MDLNDQLFLEADITKESVVDKIRNHITMLIRTGKLVPGQKLPSERDLARYFQVSRPTVREALNGIQTLGIINVQHGGGVYISSLSALESLEPLHWYLELTHPDLDALQETRILIEEGLARGIIHNIRSKPTGKKVLQQIHKNMEIHKGITSDAVSFRLIDMEFHRLLRELNGNGYLSKISSYLYLIGAEYRHMAWESPDILRQSYLDHVQIVQAIEARDEAALAAALRSHIEHVNESIASNL